jgi:hypothetical protein
LVRIHPTSVADPNSLNPDPGFDDKKLKKKIQLKKKLFFSSKIVIYLSLGLHKGSPSYKRSPQH